MRHRGFRLLLVALGLTAFGAAASAQDEPPSLRVEGLLPAGGRGTLTEGWGALRFTVENRGSVAREARVVVFYPERRDVQFARDVWVPGAARVTSWLPVGPPPALPSPMRRDINYRLYERVDGVFRPVGSSQPDRLPSRAEPYRAREPTTALYTDAVVGELDDRDPLAAKDSPASEAVELARAFRHARGLSESVSIVLDRQMPPTPEAFDGVDHFVLAGNRLAADPAGRQALRHWVLHGGTLWVLLDRVDADVVAPVLGEGQRFQVVGRTSLTTVRLRGATEDPARAETREFDRPVEMVRVLLSGSETALYEANGWPAAFSQPLGRGQVVFTTLGARGWHRPRTARDGRSRFENAPDLPVPLAALEGLAGKVYPEPRPEPLVPDDLAPMLAAEIGYEVAGRGTAAAILGGFVLGVLSLGLWLRRSRSPELIGLAAPALALAVAVAFVALGAGSRRAAPPTAASVAVVEVSPESGEADRRGLFAVYSPHSGAAQIGTERGGRVELDASGLEGQPRTRVQTDLDAWHWEGLAFPAGVRLGPFRSTGRTGVSATGRFGPRGLEGRLAAGEFRDPADAVVVTRSGAALAARLEADGTFRAASDDVLPAGQYLPGAVLTDRQQRRHAVYQKLLARAGHAPVVADRDRLLVWAEANDAPFAVGGAERTVSAALLVVPIEFARPPMGVSVTVPAGFLPYAALRDGRSVPPTMEANVPARTRLRFQLPPSARHLALERATLVVRVHAPSRKFSVAGVTDARPVPLHETLGPGGLVRVEITDARLLRPDPAGGLLVEIAVSERIDADGRERPLRIDEPEVRWRIESLGLEVVGRAEGN